MILKKQLSSNVKLPWLPLPPQHVNTRWLSLHAALSRFVQQWDPLKEFFKEEVGSKSKATPKPQSQTSTNRQGKTMVNNLEYQA